MTKEKRIYSQRVKDRYEGLLEGFSLLEVDNINILTGSNGSGKSMIRKQLPFTMGDRLKIDPKEAQQLVMSTSMDARTGSNPEMGALSGMMRDTDWFATSQNTFNSIEGIFNAASRKENDKQMYLVIDEFEIGCSEETILALIHYISDNLIKLKKDKKIMGAMIITHSRLAVKELKADTFINLDGLTKEEWLNREVIPTDLEELNENEMFSYIRDIQNGSVKHTSP